LGFAQARVQQIKAWARLFALFALALLVVVSLGVRLLVRGGPRAVALLRRVASRRRGRWELSVASAMVSLLQADKSLFAHLSPHITLDLEASLANVSFLSLNHRRTGLLIGSHHLAQLFGVQLCGKSSRAHQITEHHRELAALGFWSSLSILEVRVSNGGCDILRIACFPSSRSALVSFPSPD
jgi:hypothetical protein